MDAGDFGSVERFCKVISTDAEDIETPVDKVTGEFYRRLRAGAPSDPLLPFFGVLNVPIHAYR